MSDETTILYRPVGEAELALIAASDYHAFPPRLEWQPIFYPVLNEEYARQIARDWNARDGKHGYVTQFAVRSAFLARHVVQTVGSAMEPGLRCCDRPQSQRRCGTQTQAARRAHIYIPEACHPLRS